MNWPPTILTIIAAFGGSAVVSGILLKFLADGLLESLKAQHSKDQAVIAHERSILMAERQNAFSMGANSHMAAIVFDKYIEFCEEYVAAVSKTLSRLVQAEDKDSLLDTRDFFEIRQKSALWISHEIDAKLDEFERRFEQNAPFYDNTSGVPAPISNETNVKQIITAVRL